MAFTIITVLLVASLFACLRLPHPRYVLLLPSALFHPLLSEQLDHLKGRLGLFCCIPNTVRNGDSLLMRIPALLFPSFDPCREVVVKQGKKDGFAACNHGLLHMFLSDVLFEEYGLETVLVECAQCCEGFRVRGKGYDRSLPCCEAFSSALPSSGALRSCHAS